MLLVKNRGIPHRGGGEQMDGRDGEGGGRDELLYAQRRLTHRGRAVSPPSATDSPDTDYVADRPLKSGALRVRCIRGRYVR